MSKTYFLLVLLLLVGCISGQSLTLSEEQLADTALMTQLNNYFGCRVWSGDSCIECAETYYFNKNGICCCVDEHCLQFNTQEGVCERCYEGYSVVNGTCTRVDNTAAANIGCARWSNGVCQACSRRWYFNQENVCVPVSDLCRTWDETTGVCLTCYYGSSVQ